MRLILLVAILFISNELETYAQTFPAFSPKLRRLSFLVQNLDSITRSYAIKGFTITPGKREPGGIFSNFVRLQDGSEILLETTTSRDSTDWRLQALKEYG